MVAESRTSELKQAIRDFEFQIDVPVSINRTQQRDEWKLKTNESFDRLSKLVERQRQEIHTKLFAEIASQSDSERSTIQKLRHADERIGELLGVVKAHLTTFALGTEEVGPGPDVESQLLELRDIGHCLTASLLAQEEAVTAWFAESFDPDAETP